MCESCSVVSDSLWPHRLQPSRLLCSWNSPGQNTGVGSRSLLQGIFPTQGLNPGLLHCRQIHYHLSHQERPRIVGGGVAYPFSRGSSQPRDWTQVSCIAGRFFTSWATREATQVSIRMQIYFYVRPRMSGMTQQALMKQETRCWDGMNGFHQTQKAAPAFPRLPHLLPYSWLGAGFHVCSCWLGHPALGQGMSANFKGHCVLDGILIAAGVSVINTHSDCIIFHSSTILSTFTLRNGG